MKVHDCFSFFNELDLLEIRLHELWDVVDYFVLVEATTTHSGISKPLYYDGNKQRFYDFSKKIIHIVVKDMPITKDEIEASLSSKDREWIESGYQKEDNWVRERFQRNAMMRFLDLANPNDIVIIGDADEIVRASTVEWVKENIHKGSIAVSQTMYSYYLNVKSVSIPWSGSKIIQNKFISTPSEDRFHTLHPQSVDNGGWHFNFMGGADAIRQKIRSYAHQEYATLDNLFKVEDRLGHLQDVLGRQDKYEVVPLDNTYPKYVLENQSKFSHLIYK
jgi:beta-1,4-mannosyl-glycoprotein beta-1,4-N-acetylglucosaminyltransferase